MGLETRNGAEQAVGMWRELDVACFGAFMVRAACHDAAVEVLAGYADSSNYAPYNPEKQFPWFCSSAVADPALADVYAKTHPLSDIVQTRFLALNPLPYMPPPPNLRFNAVTYEQLELI